MFPGPQAVVGCVVESDAKQRGWDQLDDIYAERLDITSTGWLTG